MRKLILFIFIVILISIKCYAKISFDIGYYADKQTNIKTLSFEQNFTRGTLDCLVSAKYRQNNSDFYYNTLFNTDIDLTKNISVFGFTEAQHDTVLNIDDRIDIGAGIGYRFLDGLFTKNKISYALVFLGDRLNHSFRYKINYDSMFFGSSFFINYMIPVNELSTKFEIFAKIMQTFGIGYNIEYRTNNKSQDYIQNIFLKLSFE